MTPPKKPGVARHFHFDPYVRVKEADRSASIDEDARIDKTLKWIDSQPSGLRTKLIWELIVAAVNGELGIAPSVSMGDEDAELNESALKALLANMEMNEE